jgi:hypothetical protein
VHARQTGCGAGDAPGGRAPPADGTPATDDDTGSMTYAFIDADCVARLARDLGGVEPCLRFVDDFVGSLTSRIERVQHAVDRGDLDDARAALLGLSTSSAMIGAMILSAAARDLHAEVARVHAVPTRTADILERLGMASCDELAQITAPWRVSA